MEIQGKELLKGTAEGEILSLGAPLSLWDGIDSQSGRIIQSGHPNYRESIANKILVFANGLSGATAGAALTESLRTGYGPSALVLPDADSTVVTASVVAGELYNKQIPIFHVAAQNISEIPDKANGILKDGILKIKN